MIKSAILVIVSLFLAYALMLLPLPYAIASVRPELPLLVYLYWVLAFPRYHGVLIGVFVGAAQDLFMGAVIGTHIIAYAPLYLLFSAFYQRIRMQDAWRQALVLLPLLLLSHTIKYLLLTYGAAGSGFKVAYIVFPAISGALLWPWLMNLLRGLRRKLQLINRLI